jgi:putative SOS response-associated peptidase YedK
MCGRVVQISGPLRLAIVDGFNVNDNRMSNVPRRYKAAPRQELLVIRRTTRQVSGFPSLHCASRWFLRMASRQGCGPKATLCHRNEGWLALGLAGLWENWRDPNTGEWERTFAVITVPSNELVGQIHDRMPAILKPDSYDRWLSSLNPIPMIC